MKTPPSDDDLRRRLQELGQRESATAPRFDRVWPRRREPAARFSRLRPAVALAGVLLVAAAAWWWPTGHGGGSTGGTVAMSSSRPPEQWGLPTDGLLNDVDDAAGTPEVERLSREIEGLLQ